MSGTRWPAGWRGEPLKQGTHLRNSAHHRALSPQDSQEARGVGAAAPRASRNRPRCPVQICPRVGVDGPQASLVLGKGSACWLLEVLPQPCPGLPCCTHWVPLPPLALPSFPTAPHLLLHQITFQHEVSRSLVDAPELEKGKLGGGAYGEVAEFVQGLPLTTPVDRKLQGGAVRAQLRKELCSQNPRGYEAKQKPGLTNRGGSDCQRK